MKKLLPSMFLLVTSILFSFNACKVDSDDVAKVADAISNSNNNSSETNTNTTTPKDYSLVVFYTDGGTEIPTQKVGKNCKVFKPIDPVKNGYTFGGWFIDSTFTTPFDFNNEISVDINLYAKWLINSYTVSFFVYSDYYKSFAKFVTFNSAVDEPANPEKTGYTFQGWYGTNGNLFDFSQPITCNTSIYAKWKINTYTVTYDTDGGTEIPPKTVEYGSSANPYITPEKAYCRFKGWKFYNYDNYLEDYYGQGVTKDMTLYADWETLGTPCFSVTVLSQSDIEVTKTTNGNTTNFSVSTDYTVLGWYLDNSLVSSDNSYSVDAGTLSKGSYILELEASKNGNYYSYTVQIKIE